MTEHESTCDAEHVVCPYCGCRHPGGEWVRDDYEQTMNCDGCERPFLFSASFDVRYHARPIKETASVDTRPKDEDATKIAASLASGAVPAQPGDAQKEQS